MVMGALVVRADAAPARLASAWKAGIPGVAAGSSAGTVSITVSADTAVAAAVAEGESSRSTVRPHVRALGCWRTSWRSRSHSVGWRARLRWW